MRNEAVAVAPKIGNNVLAIAAPDCTLMIASNTAGIGGILTILFFTLLNCGCV